MPSGANSTACCLRQMREARFAGAVGGAQRRGAQARDRRDVDDGAAALVAHQRRGGLRAQERSGEIDGEHARPVLVGDVENRLEDGDAGIVDQRVEPAELRSATIVERARDACGIGDVAGEWRGDVGLVERGKRSLQIVAVDVEQRDAPAVGEEALRRGKPDAARGAGHQDATWFWYPSFPPMPASYGSYRLFNVLQWIAGSAQCRRLLANGPVLRKT